MTPQLGAILVCGNHESELLVVLCLLSQLYLSMQS